MTYTYICHSLCLFCFLIYNTHNSCAYSTTAAAEQAGTPPDLRDIAMAQPVLTLLPPKFLDYEMLMKCRPMLYLYVWLNLFGFFFFFSFIHSFSEHKMLTVLILQDDGWPLGLHPLNVRVGLVRSRDLSFSTLLTRSTTSSADSSSDLDTEVSLISENHCLQPKGW